MATAGDDGGRWGVRERGHGGRGGYHRSEHDRRGHDGGRWGNREQGHGVRWGDRERGQDRLGGDRARGCGRGRPPNWHAAASNAASVVPQVPTPNRLPSEGPGATEAPELRHTGDAQYEDTDVEKMKKLVQELELKNADLQKKLELAQAEPTELNKYINSDPIIVEQLKKCHDLFLCPNESGHKKLRVFLTDSHVKFIVDIEVPGLEALKEFNQLEKDLVIYIPKGLRESRKEAKKLKRMSTVAKHILLGIIEAIYRLHRLGLSLNGNFKLEDFYWTDLKKVKFDPALKLVASQRERNKMINDFHRIYQIVLERLPVDDKNFSMPDDLQILLDLLNSADPVKHQEIIWYNMSLLSEIGKKSHFITLYDRLLQQIREDETNSSEEEKKSEKVLRFIATHFTDSGDDEEPWSSLAKNNAYVGAVYDVRCLQKSKVLEEPLDLLIVWRNALSHVLDNSVKDGESLFKDEDLVNILESAIHGVFNELQKGMSDVGLLELPHLMRTMRM